MQDAIAISLIVHAAAAGRLSMWLEKRLVIT
jgi:hypothetical protein